MGSIIKGVVILSFVFLISYFSSPISGRIYENLFSGPSSADVDVGALIGLPLSYIFFLPLLFTALGDKNKHWWIGIGLLPAAAFELYFDLAHIYFPILLGLAGWGIEFGIAKLKSNM